jgi:hypothetical protein
MEFKEILKIMKAGFIGKIYINKYIPYLIDKKHNIEKSIEEMALYYYGFEAYDRKMFQFRLKYKLEDCEHVSLVSIPFVFIGIIFNNLFGKNKVALGIIGSICYLLYSIFIVRLVEKIKYIKLYLSIIQDLNEGKLIINKENIEILKLEATE